MGFFDFLKKKKVEEVKEEVQLPEGIEEGKTYFIPSGICSNGLSGLVKNGTLKIGDYFKLADNSTDYIIQLCEMYNQQGEPIQEAQDGETVAIYAKVNGSAFRGYTLLEKIE